MTSAVYYGCKASNQINKPNADALPLEILVPVKLNEDALPLELWGPVKILE